MDQPVLAELIRLTLTHGVYVTRVARDGVEATALLDQWQPHLAVIDMDVSDRLIMERLGHSTTGAKRIAVIALTKRGDLKTKLAAFEQGADDILSVPFSPEELVARTLAIMRRTYPAASALTPVIRLGDLEIDILNRHVRTGTAELHLTSLEQSLLYLLAANAGRLITRDEIVNVLWGVDYAMDSNLVDQHIRNLRAKLRDDWRRPRFIATVPGHGYRFLPPTGHPAPGASPGPPTTRRRVPSS